MPITAIPPATDIPMIEPVLRPELSSGGGDEVGDGIADEDWPPVIVMVTATPLLVVSWIKFEVVGEKTGDWLGIEVEAGVVLALVLVGSWEVGEEGADVAESVLEVDWSTVDTAVVVETGGGVVVVVGLWALSWREKKEKKQGRKES